MPEGWSTRVAFSESGGFAYRPNELFVHHTRADDAELILGERQSATVGRAEQTGSFVRFTNVEGELDGAATDLQSAGIASQPNHVLFSHSQGCCGCGPHPSLLWSNPFTANPFTANPFTANPFTANPFTANPFTANPFTANPFTANPFTANPFTANSFQPNPQYLVSYAGERPETAEFRSTGWRPHSAHPATAPMLPDPGPDPAEPSPSVVIIDTGIASGALLPYALTGVIPKVLPAGVSSVVDPIQAPQETPDGDGDHHIDPVAGHGTFIAGIIKRIAPACKISVHGPINGYGDVSEDDIAVVLESLLAQPPDLLNLSFGGYTVVAMARLGEAIRKLQAAGTVIVASAGNDATCRPSYPAAFPDVVSVGALGPNGPAPFTNFGPWVRACAPGVDVVSTFFTEWQSTVDPSEKYGEWVRWSGTSFAAPAVVGALAQVMRDHPSGKDAVARLIDDSALLRVPGLGTVVNQTPRWQRAEGSA
jgi:Subtilase family